MTVYLNDPAFGANPTDPVANAAAIQAATAAALADDSRRLVIGAIYRLNDTAAIHPEIQLQGQNVQRSGFDMLDHMKPTLRLDGGAGTERGSMRDLCFWRGGTQPPLAAAAVPHVELTGNVQGYAFAGLDMHQGARSIAIVKDSAGRFPQAVTVDSSRFGGFASAIYTDKTNGLRVTDCAHNGGRWEQGDHYDATTLVPGGQGWVPYHDSALVEVNGEGVDGVWVRGASIGNLNGRGLLWIHNTQGHTTGVVVDLDERVGGADKVSIAGVHIEARRPVIDVTLNGWNWSGFGPGWVAGVIVESYGPNHVQEFDIHWGGRYLPGALVALASRNGGTFRDVEMWRCRSMYGARVGQPMTALELSTAYGADIRVRGLVHSGYSAGYNACPAANFTATGVEAVPIIP